MFSYILKIKRWARRLLKVQSESRQAIQPVSRRRSAKILLLVGFSVLVSVVFPGAVGSNIAQNSGVRFSQSMERLQGVMRPLAPSKAARIILDGVEKNRYRILVGPDAVFMDLLYRLSPRLSARLIHQLMKSLLQ